jgi:Ca2+-binding RTX toxin-like protein
VDYSNFFGAGAISVTLQGDTTTTVTVAGSDDDTIAGIENIIGTVGIDTIIGDDQDNLIDGRAGDDTLDGGLGTDTILGGAGADMITASVGADTTDGGTGIDTIDFSGLTVGQSIQVTLDGANDSNVIIATGDDQIIRGIENITGTNEDDQITGDGQQNIIQGLAGDDVLGASQGSDTMDKSVGNDTVDYSDLTGVQRINVTLNGPNVTSVQVIGGTTDQISNIENVIGTAGNDSLTGDTQSNHLEGLAGDDTLIGAEGSDILDGGDGLGDTVDYSGATESININLATGVVADDGYQSSDTVIDVENVIGSDFDDIIVGNADANTLDSGDGDDALTASVGSDEFDGGDGSDTLDYSGLTGVTGVAVTLNGQSTVNVTVTGGDNDTVTNVENVIGSTGDDDLGGDLYNNRFEGLAGSDNFTASAGTDTYLGGDGSDTLDYSTFFAAGAINVQLQGASNSTVFVAGSGNDTIDGGAGTDTISGGEGNDTIMASAGADVTDGGDGVDTVDFSGLGGGQSIDVILQGATVSTVTVANGDDQSISNVENIVGTAGDDQITGNEEANIIQSLAGDDMLGASAGADTLDGGAGSDTLDYSGVAGIQSINVTLDDNNVTTVQIVGGANDDISNIENIIGTTGNDVIIGDFQDNHLQGRAGDDLLIGSAGSDILDGGDGLSDTVDYSAATNDVNINFTHLIVPFQSVNLY